jgi:hypothetical protein
MSAQGTVGFSAPTVITREHFPKSLKADKLVKDQNHDQAIRLTNPRDSHESCRQTQRLQKEVQRLNGSLTS